MPEYLDLEDVLFLHKQVMERLGRTAQPLARPESCLSALDRPRWLAEFESADIIRQAACLGMGVVRAHAFVDGNKRTAFQCMVVFLRLNGYTIPGKMTNLELARLLERLAHPDVADACADSCLEEWVRTRVVRI